MSVPSEDLRSSLRRSLAADDRVRIVAECTDPVELLVAVGDFLADAVVMVLGDDGLVPGSCSHLLMEYPDVRVVAFSRDRSRGVVLHRAVTSERIQGGDDEQIVAAICG